MKKQVAPSFLDLPLLGHTAWFLGFLLLTLLIVHPYLHALETLGLDQSSSCHWVQTSLSLPPTLLELGTRLLVAWMIVPHLLLTGQASHHFIFSRGPPSDCFSTKV